MKSIENTIASLRRGDKVEIVYRGTLKQDTSQSLYLEIKTKNGQSIALYSSNIDELRVIEGADPGCPFEMGAKVHWVGQGPENVYEVVGWQWAATDRQWLVMLQSDFATQHFGIHPDQLEVVPEYPEPPVGSVAVFHDQRDGELVPMKRMFDGRCGWIARALNDAGSWETLLEQFGDPIAVHEPEVS